MLANVPRWVLILACGGALLLPMLGSYGLWDPAEVREADVARDMMESGAFGDVTVDGRYALRPVLHVWLVATGFKLFGVNELAGRLPLALCGLLALLLAYRFTRRLLSENAGVTAAFVLATTPTFLFQSRQLVSEVAFYACLLAAVGGLAAELWPADGRRSRLDLVAGALGLVGGFLARGLLLGTLFPLAALALSVALSWRNRHQASGDGIWPANEGPDLRLGDSVGAALRSSAKAVAIALGVSGAAIALLATQLEHGNYLLSGGELQRLAMPPTFEGVFRALGFGFFPWFALLPVALGIFVWTQRTAAEERSRDAFVKLLLVILASAAYVIAVLWQGYLGKLHFPALPWVAVAVGVLLWETWASGARYRLWGLIGAAMILALQQDFFMAPESLAFSHLLQQAKYPAELDIKHAVRAFGILLALMIFFAFGGRPGRVAHHQSAVPWIGGMINTASRLADRVAAGIRYLLGPRERHIWIGGAITVLVFAGWCAWYLTPQLSLHMSNKALFQTYHRCKSSDERLAQYLVSGRGAAYYNNGAVDTIRNQAELFGQLRAAERRFVLIPATQLGAIDQAARQANVRYHVLDDRNSQYLIISNKLAGQCAEDLNPLRRLVLSTPPNPRHKVSANFENKVMLLGYDVDDTVSRGGKFTIKLYFKVLSRVPSGYKLFIHFDQPASRFHGDHEPLGGKYPTQYWLPGDYIVDPHEVDIPLLTTPSGRYTMYMGFWLGSQRLKVVAGPNDGSNRVRIGTLRVR